MPYWWDGEKIVEGDAPPLPLHPEPSPPSPSPPPPIPRARARVTLYYDDDNHGMGSITCDVTTGEIIDLFISEGHRKKGIGRNLVNKARQLFLDNGLKEMYAQPVPTARDFWVKLQFIHRGHANALFHPVY